ncbi:MAG: DUF4019 domain-containing protein [Pyrinomonadaceae bacterium]
MKFSRLLLFITFICRVFALVGAQEFVGGVELTTTKAPWSIRIFDNDFDIANIQAKPDESSAYFMMTGSSSKLNVSVFIEPVDKCKTSEECRDRVLSLGNPEWGKFEQLTKGKIKDFSYFEFYRPEVKGQPMKMLDMYAEYVSDGYWIDLHISKALSSKTDHALFEKVVNSVVFVPRTAAPAGAFDAQRSKAHTAALGWLSIWEQAKCKESYTALSPTTQKGITEIQWISYCSDLTKELGTKRSRKPIAIGFTNSSAGNTDRPLALLAFHSAFSNQPSIVEFVALILERDGRWAVTNYILR